MLNKKYNVVELLHELHLSTDEAKMYLELLKGPTSHLRLSHATGINRTKVYRLADQLEKRGLIATRSDDRGTFLVASDAATLELVVVTQEEKAKRQRVALEALLPLLTSIKADDSSKFVVLTYDGADGFKQMLWHELKTTGECLILGGGNISNLVADVQWAEKHRALTIKTNYHVRELQNPNGNERVFTLNQEFLDRYYSYRLVDPGIIMFGQQITIYNDTVAIYNWHQEQKVGIEIINAAYAKTMRQIFEHYWQLANDPV